MRRCTGEEASGRPARCIAGLRRANSGRMALRSAENRDEPRIYARDCGVVATKTTERQELTFPRTQRRDVRGSSTPRRRAGKPTVYGRERQTGRRSGNQVRPRIVNVVWRQARASPSFRLVPMRRAGSRRNRNRCGGPGGATMTAAERAGRREGADRDGTCRTAEP